MPFILPSEYQKRRARFMACLKPNSLAVIPGASEYYRNADNVFPFRQNSDFYYLTGFSEPDAIAVFYQDKFILFNRPHVPAKALWHGPQAGQKGAKDQYGAHEAYPFEDFKKYLADLLKKCDTLYFTFGRQTYWDTLMCEALTHLHTQSFRYTVPETIINPESYLHHQRLYKSEDEIKTIQKAVDISVKAHIKAMQVCQPGLYEYHLQAVLMQTFLQEGSLATAYPPIVGAGENSCILHYTQNNRQMQDGELVLIDAGCEYENYASDLTRTFPVNGTFSAEQKALYALVQQAQEETLKKIRPGLPWSALQESVKNVLSEGLRELGILKKPQDLSRFYMHGAGHWLGLDTHDAGIYETREENKIMSQPLEAGMVFTLEPGLYIPANQSDIPPAFWNIGIRIEDNICMTETGYTLLSEKLPKNIDDIEALMA